MKWSCMSLLSFANFSPFLYKLVIYSLHTNSPHGFGSFNIRDSFLLLDLAFSLRERGKNNK